MKKRTVEVFVSGCPLCDEMVKLVQSIMCEHCELTVSNVATDPATLARAKQYGVKRVPTVVVDGKIADCCKHGEVDKEAVRALGVGVAL